MLSAGILLRPFICAVYPRSRRAPSDIFVQNDPVETNMATRRQVLQASGALFVSSLTKATVFAQEAYPGSREVHVIAGFPAGSPGDIVPRYFSENMRPLLGATI